MLQVSWRALRDAEGKTVMLCMGQVGHALQKRKRSPGAEQDLQERRREAQRPLFSAFENTTQPVSHFGVYSNHQLTLRGA